jgi:hypothetical protein
MTMRRAIAAAVLSVVACGCPAKDGNALIADCHSAVDTLNGNHAAATAGGLYCMGLVKGVYDTLELWAPPTLAGKKMCFPEKIMVGQLARVLAKYLDDHPVDLAYEDTTLTAFAIVDAFACAAAPASRPASQTK